MAVSKRLRYEVLRRDNHACRYCGSSAPEVKLAVDHVVPVALGGSDEPSNLVTACVDCNAGKSASAPDGPIVDDVRQKALVWAAAMEVASEQRELELRYRRNRNKRFAEDWEIHRPHYFRSLDLPNGWELSLDRFSKAGMSDRDIIEMIPVAMGSQASDKWKYFCGCCWKAVRELQDSALEIVTQLEREGE